MAEPTPNPIGDLPPKAARMLEDVHASMVAAGHDERTAWAGAWCTVDRHYRRDKHGRWRKRRKALPAVGAAACPSPSQAKKKRAPKKRKPNPVARLKRAPVAVGELVDTSDHGHVLALTVEDGEHRRFRFKHPRPLMQWSQHTRALVWVTGVKTPRRSPIGQVDAKSRAAFERFHGRGIDGVRVMRRPKLEGDWQRIGRAVQIEYSNPEKWGRDGAEHDFTSAVVAYRFGGARGPALWVLRGGSLRMTGGGIEG